MNRAADPWVAGIRLWCLVRPVVVLVAGLALSCGFGIAGANEEADGTVVIYRAGLDGSERLARHYARERGIAEQGLIALQLPDGMTLTREQYERSIEIPLRRRLADDPPRFVAIMWGIPRRIAAEVEEVRPGTTDAASIDSELAAMFLPGKEVAGALRNPLFGRMPRSSAGAPVSLVARVDAPSAKTARRMLADGLEIERKGRKRGFAYIDHAARRGGYRQGDEWLERAEDKLWGAGVPVVAERSGSVWLKEYPMDHAAVYLGWYAPHVTGPFTSDSFRFQPGAVAVHLHSFSAEEIEEDRRWVGPLLETGAAAGLGNVFEPYLPLTTRLDLFVEQLLEGRTLAEAAWTATPVLSWMTVVHGDPLYRPFARRGSGDGSADDPRRGQPGIDRLVGDMDARSVEEVMATAQEAGDAWLMEAVGLAWLRLGAHENALRAFQAAAARTGEDRDRLRLLLHQAEVLRSLGRFEKAVGLLRAHEDSFQAGEAREGLRAVLMQMDPPAP